MFSVPLGHVHKYVPGIHFHNAPSISSPVPWSVPLPPIIFVRFLFFKVYYLFPSSGFESCGDDERKGNNSVFPGYDSNPNYQYQVVVRGLVD